MRRATLASRLVLVLGAVLAAPVLLRADDGPPGPRLTALAAQLKTPEGFRAVYKLVDAGPAAVSVLLSKLGEGSLSDERIELCLREIARTKEGAQSEISKLGMAAQPATRARLARALAAAGALDAVYPLVDALDGMQEPLEVVSYGPTGSHALDSQKIEKPVTQACALFGERAASAIRKRLPKSVSPVFRLEAVSVLGAIKSTPSASDLVALADDEKLSSDERVAALAALAAIKAPAARAAFANALASDDGGLRRAGARGLAALPDPGALPQLVRLVEEDREEDVRLEAARALAVLDDPLTAPPLRAALASAAKASESRRPLLVAACVNGLALSRDHSGTGEIVKVLDQGMGFTVERIASQALARIPDLGFEPRERLRAIAEDASSPPIPRACACWVLAQRGEEGPLATLLGLGKHKDVPVRLAVGQLLAEGKLEGAIAALELLAADPSERVRRVAIVALGKSEGSIAGAALVRVARHVDPDPVVRKVYASAVVEALEQGTLDQKDRAAVRPLLVAALEKPLRDGAISERRAQANALARLGDRAALLRLATAALATSELPVESRRAAIEALAGFARSETTEGALLELLKDPLLGDDAAVALARLRKETFFEATWRERLAPGLPIPKSAETPVPPEEPKAAEPRSPAAATPAAPTLELANPEYALWSGFKEGSWALLRIESEAYGNTTKMEYSYTLLSLSKEKAVIETKGAMTMGGKKIDIPPTRREIPAILKSNPPRAPLREGTEEIEVAGKKLSCHWTESESEAGGTKTTARVWQSSAIPGGLARMESSQAGAAKSQTKMWADSWEAK